MDQSNRIHQSITSQQNTNLNISSEQIVLQLENKVNELFECEKIGDYVKAESIKMRIEELKKEIDAKRLKQLIQRQKKEKNSLEKENQRDIEEFNAKWNQKMLQFDCQKDKQKKELAQKHGQELAKARIQLESQFSTKIKESSECLNLRKIQEQLKKQRKYSQAHEIQKRVQELQVKQKKSFEKQRHIRIQTTLQKIKNKQKVEVSAWQKKNESAQNQLLQEKQKQLEKIRLKNNNSMKDMILKHQKEVLAEKGKLKNRASLNLSKSPSKYSSTKRI